MKKRIVSIVLAAAMLCAMLTVFASADEHECDHCGEEAVMYVSRFCQHCCHSMAVAYRRYDDGKPYSVPCCSYVITPHNHYNRYETPYYWCINGNCNWHHDIVEGDTTLSASDLCSIVDG